MQCFLSHHRQDTNFNSMGNGTEGGVQDGRPIRRSIPTSGLLGGDDPLPMQQKAIDAHNEAERVKFVESERARRVESIRLAICADTAVVATKGLIGSRGSSRTPSEKIQSARVEEVTDDEADSVHIPKRTLSEFNRTQAVIYIIDTLSYTL